jgi:hypothetical protein
MAAHNTLAVLFVVAVVAHAALNWRPLLRHVRGLSARALPLSREAVTALAITAALLLLSLGHVRIADERGVQNQGVEVDPLYAIAPVLNTRFGAAVYPNWSIR